MSVGVKSFSSKDFILVNNSETPKINLLGIIILGKRKSMIGIQPTIVSVASFLRFAYSNHQFSSFLSLLYSQGFLLDQLRIADGFCYPFSVRVGIESVDSQGKRILTIFDKINLEGDLGIFG
ncbi:hypothetical protein MICAI_580001 [Microcystis sp. T1-4]|nr:hypothetical protein MICAI_580001 [Microcystis sp. T1-4]